MLDPIVIPTLYFISVVELILQAGVFFYAYRVTKLTGSFRAWTLIIAAFALLTVRNVVSLLFELMLPTDQISTLIESVGDARKTRKATTASPAFQSVNVVKTHHVDLLHNL